jgi:predicted nucleic acid-binding protein
MPEFLLDTCILIDVLRKHRRAMSYFRRVSIAGTACFHSVSVAELVEGAADAEDQRKTLRLARQIPWVYPTDADSHFALRTFCELWLARNVGYLDCTIAATALRRNNTLATHNIKHFRNFPSLRVIRPY